MVPPCVVVSILGVVGCCVPFGWSGLFPALGRSAGGPADSGGGARLSLEESRRKNTRAPPWTRVLWPLVPTRWFWGLLSLGWQRGYYFRYAKTDLGRIFPGKYTQKAFCERKFPNQGT